MHVFSVKYALFIIYPKHIYFFFFQWTIGLTFKMRPNGKPLSFTCVKITDFWFSNQRFRTYPRFEREALANWK